MGVKLSANADFSGTITFKGDGTYENKLMSKVDVEISIPMSCLMGAGCDVFDGGVADGDACVSRQMGTQDMKDETGTYTTDGNSIELIKDGDTSSSDQSEYCVDGDTLTVTGAGVALFLAADAAFRQVLRIPGAAPRAGAAIVAPLSIPLGLVAASLQIVALVALLTALVVSRLPLHRAAPAPRPASPPAQPH